MTDHEEISGSAEHRALCPSDASSIEEGFDVLCLVRSTGLNALVLLSISIGSPIFWLITYLTR